MPSPTPAIAAGSAAKQSTSGTDFVVLDVYALPPVIATASLWGLMMHFGTLLAVRPVYHFIQEDAGWLLVGAALLGALVVVAPREAAGRFVQEALARQRLTLMTILLIVFVVTLGGTVLVHLNYAHTVDEYLARFDGEIFAHGLAMAPVPDAWRAYAPALLPHFGLPVTADAAWVSAYLPGNAAFRALVGAVLVPQAANPLLAVAALWATWSIAQQLWPQRIDAALVALLLMATSLQLLFMAMTSFAMTGHLVLNLIWLRLVMRDDTRGHAGAMALGFVACGWHQVAFHPLFAAPFIARMWWSRQWTLAAVYTGVYSVIGLFWISYWHWIAAASDVTLAQGAGSGAALFVARAFTLIDKISLANAGTMALNFARFAAWQNPLMLVLIATLPIVPDRTPVVLRLAVSGLALTLLVVALLMPYQGHGWGYRYMHGYIGILCLLASAAWVQIVPAERARTSAVWSPLLLSCLFVAVVMLPLRSMQVHAYIEPYVRASSAIAGAAADIVIIDERGLFYGEDLPRNDPFLRNRPLAMGLPQLTDQNIGDLCRAAPRVALFDSTSVSAAGIFHFDPMAWPDAARMEQRKARIMALPCYVEMRGQ